jgi:positive regulator of sigma E activity
MQPTPETVEGTLSLLSKADSAVLILLVVIFVALYLLAPRYGRYLSGKNADQQELITVIKQNTEAYTALRTVFEQNNSHCDSCKADQMVVLTKISDAITAVRNSLTGVEKRNTHEF